MNKDAYYFPHFSNARQDRKIRRIRKDLGIEGYGIFFMVLEVLRDQDGFKYPLEDIDLLADEFGTSEPKIKAVISNYALFDFDSEKNFFSIKFDEFMQPYLKMKQQRRQAGLASAASRKLACETKQPFNNRSTTVQQSKVKESKVKERKEKESKVMEKSPPTFLEFREYALSNKNNISEEVLRLKYDAWKENGWKDGYNKKITNWKSKLLNTLPHLKTSDTQRNKKPTDIIKNDTRTLKEKMTWPTA